MHQNENFFSHFAIFMTKSLILHFFKQSLGLYDLYFHQFCDEVVGLVPHGLAGVAQPVNGRPQGRVDVGPEAPAEAFD